MEDQQIAWFTAKCNRHYANHPCIYRYISPRPWPFAIASRPHGRSRPPRRGAGSDGSVQETGTGRPQDPRRHPRKRARDCSRRRLSTPAGGSRPSRPGFRRASTTVRIVRELPGGGMSPRFRWEPREPCGYRAGTTKNPRQTFRPTGGSVMLETLLPVRR